MAFDASLAPSAAVDETYSLPADSVAVEDDKDDYTNAMECTDQDLECVLDGMRDLWNEDQEFSSPVAPAVATVTTINGVTPINNNTKAASRPWSSRSSPSGTWVRDPATGVMRNIDAD